MGSAVRMRFHLVGLAHTMTTRAYSNCAFTELARKMADMMSTLGHDVIVYGGEENDAACIEHVVCITRDEQEALCNVTGPDTILNAGDWSPNAPHWALFNSRVVEGIRERLTDPDDIILLSQGWSQSGVVDSLSRRHKVEYAVGYTGIVENSARVFPAYSWMHAVYGRWYGSHGTRGRFWDRVIPHYFDLNDFTPRTDHDGYLMFMARLNEDKGIQVAIDTAEALGAPLVVAGQGDYPLPSWVDSVGLVGIEERARLMSGAAAVLCPSLYLEPFGKVAVESMLSGAPAITTDWGAYPETVIEGVTGFRCHNMPEFIAAAKAALEGDVDRARVRTTAESMFSEDVIGPKYEDYYAELLSPMWP